MKVNGPARPIALSLAAASLVLSGLAALPATAASAASGDDRGPGATFADSSHLAQRGGTWVNRRHSTSNQERVDLPEDRIDKVRTQHNVEFATLVHAIEWARSPRCSTSADGVDRGIYRYKIYEYQRVNGEDVRTGRWVIMQTIIEWGDGHADRGWLVTAYPTTTHTGSVPKRNGKSWTPDWANTFQFGPINNEILPGCS
jgi:hypothetical protein